MYGEPRRPTSQLRGSKIPIPTPHHTQSQGPVKEVLTLPVRTNTRVSSPPLTSVLVSQSIVFTQNQLAQLSAIKNQWAVAIQALNRDLILTPVSPQMIAEPSPHQHFYLPVASTDSTLHHSTSSLQWNCWDAQLVHICNSHMIWKSRDVHMCTAGSHNSHAHGAHTRNSTWKLRLNLHVNKGTAAAMDK